MDYLTFLSSMLEDPLPWIIAALTIVGPSVALLGLLWLFRVGRLVVVKSVICPEKRCRATVELISQVGEMGPYRGIGACSLLLGENEVVCQKSCLISSAVLEAPLL